jgi:hypothetical protein
MHRGSDFACTQVVDIPGALIAALVEECDSSDSLWHSSCAFPVQAFYQRLKVAERGLQGKSLSETYKR